MTKLGYRWRLAVMVVLMFGAMTALGARLAFLHLGPNEDLYAKILRIRTSVKTIMVGRGRVLDREEKMLALDLPARDVWVDARSLSGSPHLHFMAAHLARILDLDPEDVLDRLQRHDRQYVYLKRFVHRDVAEEVARLQFDGVFFDPTTIRCYPQEALMCHVVGFSNWEGVGSSGVEQTMDRYLQGCHGLRVSEHDARRHELYSRRRLEIQPRAGADVQLTLDQNVQFIAEEALDRAMEEHQAKGAWAIVQDVRTGEILAMAARPNYDLNAFRHSEETLRLNRSIGYVYEPGSTFKVSIIAAALNEGLVSPESVIDCEFGRWRYGGRALRDYHPYGNLPVKDVLKKSSNIGAAKVALMLGAKRVENYVRAFGFGRPSGVDLPGEEGGIFRSHNSWSAISITRIAMGHEVSVTALQMLNAVCAIANDGVLMRPQVVRRVVDPQGRTVFEAEPEVLGRPVRPETAAVMRRLMARVTEQGGTGRRAAVEGYTVAGKTGTAQKPVRGGYSDRANMASFVGFVPAEEPALGIIVVVDEPQPFHTGGRVAAPIFSEIAAEVLRYLDVPPAGAESVHRGRSALRRQVG